MSIRWKLLILLLVFSLTPLLLVSGISQRGVKQLGKIIANLAEKHRTEIVSRELQQTAEDYAKILGREKEILELSLKVIARDAERFLADNPNADSELYFAEDFDNPERAPADMIPSSKHFREAAAGRIEPVDISFDHQVFRLAPGLDKHIVTKDIARLARLLPLHKEFESQLGDILYWQYVSLESGVHVSYPGHGGFPPGYNPQKRPWYTRAVERGELVWSTPYIDASTRQVIMTASMPVHRPDGSMAGVAAIDTLLSEVLQVNELSSQWSPAMRSFLIWSGRDHKTGEFGLWVVAQKDHLKKSSTWSGLIEVEQLASLNKEGMNKLAKDIDGRKSGYLDMDYQGVDSIWSYAYVSEDVSLVLIVAKRIILAEVEQVQKAVMSLAREQWLVAEIAAAALILFLIFAAFPFSRAMTRPMMVMVEAVKRLAKGDFSARMDINTGDERDLVATSFNDMVPQLEDRMRIRKALEVAQEVQQNLLPREIPALPGFDIAASSVYCDETGGDYFDFFPCEDRDCHRFGIVVGDVTGHGVGAALLMATARALIRGLTTKPENLAECISRVNNLLTADVGQTGRFMTLFFLMIEAGSPKISWVRAGHDPAILYDPETDAFEELSGPGMVLGVEEDYTYEQVEKTIETSGAIILIGTDGIWEAHNSTGDMFGKERLYEIIRANANKSAEVIQGAVFEAINNFQGDFPQEDDITIVVIKLL